MSELTYYLQKILSQQTLTQAESCAAMQMMMQTEQTEQTAALLSLLKYRGETADELLGMIQALKNKSLTIKLPHPVLDIVGTGGDLANTVNISTGSAILAAACGIPVIKHGNRAVSSRCGSADVLEKLGIAIAMPKDQIQQCMTKVNIGFLYAPLFHPILQTLRPIRKAMGIPTVFNLLGPLLNPANAEYLLIGVAQASSLQLISDVITQMSHVKKALVFHGNGLDELTTLGKISAYEIIHGTKKQIEIDPIALGFKPCALSDIQGGDIETNATLLRDGLTGKNSAIADTFILNAGIAINLFGNAATMQEGICMARDYLYQGKALALLENWIQFSKS